MDAVPKQLDGEHHVIMMIIFTSKAADSLIYLISGAFLFTPDTQRW
jgi:hypothetical protein